MSDKKNISLITVLTIALFLTGLLMFFLPRVAEAAKPIPNKVILNDNASYSVIFSEAVDTTTATTLGNYTGVSCASAAMDGVLPTTKVNITGCSPDLVAAVSKVTIANVKDSGGSYTMDTASNLPIVPANYLKISEVSIGNSNTASGNYDEFVELYNVSSHLIQLDSSHLPLYLHFRNGSGADSNVSCNLVQNQISPHRYYLIASNDYSGTRYADATYQTFMANDYLVGNGSVYISGSAAPQTDIIDMLGWGSQPAGGCEGTCFGSDPSASGGSLERKAQASSDSATMSSGGTDFYKGNGYDSNVNNDDFVSQTTRNPQNSYDPPESLVDAVRPYVMGTMMDMPEFSSGVPYNLGWIGFGFSEAMDASTINDSDTTNPGSNITLIKTSDSSQVPGSVTYNGFNYAGPPVQFNVTAGTLEKDTQYTLTILGDNTSPYEDGVKDLAGNTLGDSDNNPLASYTKTFTTTSSQGVTDFSPPFVKGTVPSSGNPSVPSNLTSLKIIFSREMDGTVASDCTGKPDPFSHCPSINSNNIRVVRVANDGTETPVTINSITLDSTGTIATLDVGTLTAGHYAIIVSGAVTAASGSPAGDPMGPPGNPGPHRQDTASFVFYRSDFDVISTPDNTAPTVAGTYPEDGDTNVPVNTVDIKFGFSEAIDPATISSSTVDLTCGSTAISGSIDYDPIEQTGHFLADTILPVNSSCTLTLSGGAGKIADIVGNVLASDSTTTFTTASSNNDTTAPTVLFANADDFSVAVTFSEPVNANQAGNVNNYAVESPVGTTVNLTPMMNSVSYNKMTKTAKISGVPLNSGNTFKVTVTGVQDLSGNNIDVSANSVEGTVTDYMDSKGMLGPGEMSGPMDMADMGMNEKGVMPMNMMAGATTKYFINLWLENALSDGDQIVLTFPSGFDVSQTIQDAQSPSNSDFNGPEGSGTITFSNTDDGTGGASNDGISVNTSANTITITLSVSGTQSAHQSIHIDLDGIKNSPIPKSFETSGYTVDVKVLHSGQVMESFTTMPFFIGSAGSSSLSGTITASGQTSGTMNVYLGSPMTGPMSTTSGTFSGGTASYTFSNIPDGQYMLFTDPTVTIGSNEYRGLTPPRPVTVSGTTSGVNITLNSLTSGAKLTVSLSGDFSTGGSADNVDVFAGSPNGFTVKTLNNVGSTNPSTDLYLFSDGQWRVGVGPSMPMGPMAGPPPMTDWMPPADQIVTVSNCSSTCQVSPSTLTFTLSASETVAGHVKDASGSAISNAEVYGYSAQGGMSSHTKTLGDGSFNLKIAPGNYKIGAFSRGMPPSQEISVYVDSNGNVYAQGSTTPTSDLIITIAKSGYTISGRVTDGTNVVQGASVYAYCDGSVSNNACFAGPGHAETMTDNSGNYILYVSNGTWKVGAFLPQYGNLSEKTVIIQNSSKDGQNFAPISLGTFYNVTGYVYQGSGTSHPLANVVVRESDTTGNQAVTDSNGYYQIKLPNGTYTLHPYSMSLGDLPAITGITVSGGDTAAPACHTPDIFTLTVDFGTTVDEAFIDVSELSHEVANSTHIVNSQTATIRVQDLGSSVSYHISIHIPGIGDLPVTNTTASISGTGNTISGTNSLVIVADGTLSLTMPTLYTVSGTVYKNSAVSGNEIANAWVEIGNPEEGIHFGTQASSSGAYSLKVAAGTYLIGAHKPGFVMNPQKITVSGNLTGQNIVTTQSNLTISGQVKIGSSGAPNAFVRAEKMGGGFAATQTDTSGNYSLTINAGQWRLYAVAEGYREAAYSGNPITVASSSLTGKNITLTEKFTGLAAPKAQPITPSQGGSFENSDARTTINIPPNALGSSSSAGQIQAKETSNLIETPSAKPIGGKGKLISAVDSSGNPITTLDGSVTIEVQYTKAELTTGTNAISTLTQLNNLNLSYFDGSTQSWVSIPATITTNPLSPASDLSNLVTATFKGVTDHFSTLALTHPTNDSAPDTPTGLTATAGDSQVTLSWTASSEAVKYDIYRKSGSKYLWLAQATSTSYTDSGLSNGTTYYYKVSALNSDDAESAATSAVSATPTAPSGGGAVGVGGDTLPPSISQVEVSAETDSATISWTTNESSISWLVYGETTDYGEEIKTTDYLTSHSVVLSGLSPETTYHYQIKSEDSSGNVGSYTDKTFTTLSSEVLPPQEKPPAVRKPITEMTIPELKAEIARITALIAELKTELIRLTEAPPVYEGIPAGFKFENNLKYGQTSDEVKYLQIILKAEVGPPTYPDNVPATGWFGPITKASVIKFQEKYPKEILAPWKLTKGTGFVGKTTRAKMNELLSRKP